MRTPITPILLTLATLAAATRAQSAAPPAAPPSPAAFSRTLATFDFEERSKGNFESTPMFWSRLVGRGYPAYSLGQFDPALARSPGNAFRLDINGGSVAYRFTPGDGPARIPITPDADYVIIAFVKTTPLAHAKADLAAWFADDKGNLLPASEAHATPYARSPDDPADQPDGWHVLHLFLHGPPAGSPARSLALQVGLLQPQQLGPAAPSGLPARFELYQQDITGSAWFDDITVFQLPRLSVTLPAEATIAPTTATSGRGVNIFPPAAPVQLELTVSDLSPAHDDAPAKSVPLAVRLKITDPDNLLYASDTWSADPTPDHPWTHRYSHPSLPPGLYTATLDITESPSPASPNGALIARRQTRFLTLAPAPATAAPNPDFGLSAAHWPVDAWPALPALLRTSGAGLLQVPAWRDDLPDDTVRRDGPFDALLSSLAKADIRAVATFSSLPPSLSAKLNAATQPRATTQPAAAVTAALPLQPPPRSSMLNLLGADPSLWRPAISFLLARHAHNVDLWQLTDAPDAADDPLFASSGVDPRFAALYTRAAAEISPLLNRPRLVIPWNALYDFDPKSFPDALLDLRLPAAIKPDQLPAYIKSFKALTAAPGTDPDNTPILLHLDALPADGPYARADRLSDFAKRLVFARSANPAATLINLPLTPTAGGAEPDELLLVYRTLAQALAPARGVPVTVRELPLSPGLRAFLFTRAGVASTGGTLVLWNESADAPSIPLDLPIGASARQIDLNGITRQPALNTAAALTHVDVTSTPLILDQVDPRLLSLRASFALAGNTLPAGAGSFRTQAQLTNPGPEPLHAALHLLPPKGWTVEPSTLRVSLAPGETLHENITIRYPFTEAAGLKSLDARLSAEPGGSPQNLDLSFPLTVASTLVAIDGFSQLLPNGDLVVQQMITNTAATPLNAQAYALVPGYPRQQRFITDLRPGQTLIKRYTFPASACTALAGNSPSDARPIAQVLAGKTASLGVRQADGHTLLTRALPLD